MDNAIMTIASGKAYEAIGRLTHPTMSKYAAKIGGQFVVLDGPSSCFSKFNLYREFDKYDRILFLDTDIIVHPACPDLFELVPSDALGAYDEHFMADALQKTTHKTFMYKASTFYGIPITNFVFFNTGVMVLSHMHKSLFEPLNQYLQLDYYDQLLVNLRLGRAGHKTHDIGHSFNRMQYVDGRVPGTRLDANIIHYAGIQNCTELIRTDLDRWCDA